MGQGVYIQKTIKIQEAGNMTDEQKEKLEHLSKKSNIHVRCDTEYLRSDEYRYLNDSFLEGAQTILDNPSEWGFIDMVASDSDKNRSSKVRDYWIGKSDLLQSENTRLRGALESLDEDLVFLEDCAHHAEGDIATIARKKIKAALK